ncbi:hypothetical protein J7J00_05910 [Bacillus sp. ISL-4]|nr:hypothetical protein [Bacillus sp. ISL-4]
MYEIKGNQKAKINASLMIQAGGRLFLFVLHDLHVAIIFSFSDHLSFIDSLIFFLLDVYLPPFLPSNHVFA